MMDYKMYFSPSLKWICSKRTQQIRRKTASFAGLSGRKRVKISDLSPFQSQWDFPSFFFPLVKKAVCFSRRKRTKNHFDFDTSRMWLRRNSFFSTPLTPFPIRTNSRVTKSTYSILDISFLHPPPTTKKRWLMWAFACSLVKYELCGFLKLPEDFAGSSKFKLE